MIKMKHNFTALFSTNFWGVLNDNFLKTLASFIVISWINDPRWQSITVSLAAGALVLPYIFCSSFAGKLTQISSKKRILHIAKLAEIPIMLLAVAGFMLHSVIIVITAIFLMGLQSSLYSPAKYGLIRDVGGYGNISTGMGGMEAISFLAMLLGTVLASFLVDTVSPVIYYGLLIFFALMGLVCSFCIKANEEQSDEEPYTANPFVFLKNVHAKINGYQGLNSIIYSLSMFWWVAASIQMGLLIYGKQDLGLDSFHTGLVLALAAVGITSGNLLAGILDKKHFMIGHVLFFGLLSAVWLLIMFFVPMSPVPFACMLFVFAFTIGFFKLPLDTEIQKTVKGPFLSIVLAYFNQVSFIFILAASVTFSLISAFLPTKYLFLVLGVGMLITVVYLMLNYRSVICYTFRTWLHWRYKIEISGMEHLDSGKTYLILPNHVAVVDPMILFAEFYAYRIRPLVDEAYFSIGIARKVLKLFDAVCVPDLRKSFRDVGQAMTLQQTTLDTLRNGGNVLFYPSGHITLTGREEIGNRQLAYNVCRELPENVEVLGIRTAGLWGSMWSRYGRKNTPPLISTLLKSVGLVLSGSLLFRKRRCVHITIEPITDKVTQWSKENKLDFNKKLEDYYNETPQC